MSGVDKSQSAFLRHGQASGSGHNVTRSAACGILSGPWSSTCCTGKEWRTFSFSKKGDGCTKSFTHTLKKAELKKKAEKGETTPTDGGDSKRTTRVN